MECELLILYIVYSIFENRPSRCPNVIALNAIFDIDFTPGIFETPHISNPQEETLTTILIILLLLD